LDLKVHNFDLIIIIAFMVVFALISLLIQDLVLTIILGIPFMLILPGYLITLALYPKRHTIGLPERIAMSLGLSFVLLPALGIILNFTLLGIQINSLLLVIIIISALLCLSVLLQRRSLQVDEQFPPMIDTQMIWPFTAEGGKGDNGYGSRILPIILMIAILIVLVGIVYMLVLFATQEQPREHFSELIILDDQNEIVDKPLEIENNTITNLNFLINNYEGEDINYLLHIRAFEKINQSNSEYTNQLEENSGLILEDGVFKPSDQIGNFSYIEDFGNPLRFDTDASYIFNLTLNDDQGHEEDFGLIFETKGYFQLVLELYKAHNDLELKPDRLVYIIIIVS
jgi:uncharacterized membrane protein